MIEILIPSTGDRAEADDPESAAFAARTLMTDAVDTVAGTNLRLLTASFYVEGRLVREKVRYSEL